MEQRTKHTEIAREFNFEAAYNRLGSDTGIIESAGASCAGGFATGAVGGKANKPGTGKPKNIGNKIKRMKTIVGKGIY